MPKVVRISDDLHSDRISAATIIKSEKKCLKYVSSLEVDATQGYFVCDDPAFSMTLQENNSLLVGKKLYRIKSIKKK
jgi:hypothetical protein